VDEFVEICAETLGVRARKARIGVEMRKCMVSWGSPWTCFARYIKKTVIAVDPLVSVRRPIVSIPAGLG
jgi:hypothetical protein